jgi:hypothetical protein
MTDQPRRGLSGAELDALKFAAHRQLARWSNKPRLSPNQHTQRAALVRAVRILEDKTFTHGCELQVLSEENVDA